MARREEEVAGGLSGDRRGGGCVPACKEGAAGLRSRAAPRARGSGSTAGRLRAVPRFTPAREPKGGGGGIGEELCVGPSPLSAGPGPGGAPGGAVGARCRPAEGLRGLSGFLGSR